MWWKLVLINFICFLGKICSGQDLKQTFDLAEIQYRNNDLEHSKLLFQRVVYFDSLHLYKESFERLAQIYFAQKEVSTSLAFMFQYRNFYPSESEKWVDVSFEIINLQLSAGLDGEALGELIQLKNIFVSVEGMKKLNTYLAVAYFQNKDFKNSELYFKKIITEDKQVQLSKILKKATHLDQKFNPNKLQIFSLLLPGSGQAYASYLKEGANSVILVGAFLVIFVHTSRVYGLLDAFLTVYPWVSRYYMGGLKKVVVLANKRKEFKRNEYYHSILQLVK